ncbi:MAG: Fur family transcriptional regulator [bacterium]
MPTNTVESTDRIKEFLRGRGLKMTPQRELIINSFLELGEHVSVDELYQRVRGKDSSVGYSTVWRNLKLICRVGLATEVNIGDGITRYDRITEIPHGHFYCRRCRRFLEFDVEQIVGRLNREASSKGFVAEGHKIEVQGLCAECLAVESGDQKNRQQGLS